MLEHLSTAFYETFQFSNNFKHVKNAFSPPDYVAISHISLNWAPPPNFRIWFKRSLFGFIELLVSAWTYYSRTKYSLKMVRDMKIWLNIVVRFWATIFVEFTPHGNTVLQSLMTYIIQEYSIALF